MWGLPAPDCGVSATSSPLASRPFADASRPALEGDPAGLFPLMGLDMALIMCETLVLRGVRAASLPNPADLSRANPSGVSVDALDEDTDVGEEPWGWGMSEADPAGARLGWVWMASCLAGRAALACAGPEI